MAAASRSLAAITEGPPTRGSTLGRTSSVMWCCVGGDLVVVGDHSTARLPNALLTAVSDIASTRDPPVFGAGGVRYGTTMYQIARWWDPRVTVPTFGPNSLTANLLKLCGAFPECSNDPLRKALVSADLGRVTAEAQTRLGFGPGLTPLGDDILAGALVAYSSMMMALGYDVDVWMNALWRSLGPMADHATTNLSASLLNHAVRGEAAPEVQGFVRAVVRGGEPGPSLRRLSTIGHTSGMGLARGVLIGALAVDDWMHT